MTEYERMTLVLLAALLNQQGKQTALLMRQCGTDEEILQHDAATTDQLIKTVYDMVAR